jgi:hypothetical protein
LIPATLTESARLEIYNRATLEFDSAVLFKPLDTNSPDPAALTFAPLILQETMGVEADEARDRPGRLTAPNLVTSASTNRPAVYVLMQDIAVHKTPHRQFTYVWCYPLSAGPNESSAHSVQGIRLTLDSEGQPAIWEILADPTGARILFVAESVEVAAATAFGTALPGRRYAIERSLSEAPETMVARVIADGPLGPIVYLRGGTREVGTLICRCMPSQAKRLAGQSDYELRAISAKAIESLLTGASRSDGSGAGSVSKHWERSRLEKWLRLPPRF